MLSKEETTDVLLAARDELRAAGNLDAVLEAHGLNPEILERLRIVTGDNVLLQAALEAGLVAGIAVTEATIYADPDNVSA